jgi:hypothetical protein
MTLSLTFTPTGRSKQRIFRTVSHIECPAAKQGAGAVIYFNGWRLFPFTGNV